MERKYSQRYVTEVKWWKIYSDDGRALRLEPFFGLGKAEGWLDKLCRRGRNLPMAVIFTAFHTRDGARRNDELAKVVDGEGDPVALIHAHDVCRRLVLLIRRRLGRFAGNGERLLACRLQRELVLVECEPLR